MAAGTLLYVLLSAVKTCLRHDFLLNVGMTSQTLIRQEIGERLVAHGAIFLKISMRSVSTYLNIQAAVGT